VTPSAGWTWFDGRMPTAALRGIEIYYERDGSGPSLLVLNGSGSSIDTSTALLAPFRARFDVLVLDQRGLGRTSVPDAIPSMADYAADALALADHVGWGTFRVVGLSFGGMVAQELTVTAPERVERLGLVSTSPGGPDHASYPLHELAALPAQERLERGRLLLDRRFTDDWLAIHDTDRVIAEMLVERAARRSTPAQQRGEALQMEARGHHDVVDRLHLITGPVLVACGRYDGIAPVANGAAIAARVPGAELQIYEGGHVIFLFQDPTALPAVLDFLAS